MGKCSVSLCRITPSHTYKQRQTPTHVHSGSRAHSLSRESAREFGDTGVEKCKCSSFQVSGMASIGRWMCVRERGTYWRRERDAADSLCPPFALTFIAVKKHACQAAKMHHTVSGGRSVATKSHFILFILLTSLLVYFFSPSITCLSRVTLDDGNPYPWFLCSQFSLYPALSLQLPSCFFLDCQVANRVNAGFL